jgi:hypothetical protein
VIRRRRRREVPGLPDMRAGKCRVPRPPDIGVQVPPSRKGSADSVAHARSARSARRGACGRKEPPGKLPLRYRGRMYLYWLRLLCKFGEETSPASTVAALSGPHIRPRGSAHEIGGNA